MPVPSVNPLSQQCASIHVGSYQVRTACVLSNRVGPPVIITKRDVAVGCLQYSVCILGGDSFKCEAFAGPHVVFGIPVLHMYVGVQGVCAGLCACNTSQVYSETHEA